MNYKTLLKILGLFQIFFANQIKANSNCFALNEITSELVIDASFLNSETTCVYRPKSVNNLQSFIRTIYNHNLKSTKEQQIKLSIAGTKHSQGGQIFAKNGILIDTKNLNRIQTPIKKNTWQVSVEAGATWEDLHKIIFPLGLVNKVQQSSAPFSIGGSVAVNCHGRSQEFGTLYQSIAAIKIVNAYGELTEATPSKNSELFNLAVGGYGLFGVIVEITLELVENNKLTMEVFEHENLDSYIKLLKERVAANTSYAYQFSILDLSVYYGGQWIPEKFLTENHSYWYTATSNIEKPATKNEDYDADFMNTLGQVGLKMAKSSGMVRNLLQWGQKSFLEKQTSRSLILTPPIRAVLDSQNPETPDILQEYFVPVDNFVEFFKDFRKILIRQIESDPDFAISNVSLRFIPKVKNDSFLRYSSENADRIALVLYTQISRKKLKQAESWTKEIVDLTNKFGGVYYLPYQLWPTKEQLKKSYPNINDFWKSKLRYDAKELFSNRFYEKNANSN